MRGQFRRGRIRIKTVMRDLNQSPALHAWYDIHPHFVSMPSRLCRRAAG